MSLLALGTYTVQAQADQPDYVGAKECASCHRSLARDHADSNHALALQEVSRKQTEILADFTQGEAVRQVQFPGEDALRTFTADDVDFVVGAGQHVQRYLYKVAKDDYMVLPAEWNVTAGAWQPLTLGSDPWPSPAYDWEQNCAACHTTNFDVERGRWQDIGVQCEACHGPASSHVDLAKDAGRNPSDEELTAIQGAIYRSADPQVCAQCHSQGQSPDGHPYPVGYRPGANLSDYFQLVPDDSGDHWWIAGHASQQNMQSNEWLMSRHATSLTDMQTSDQAADACLTCHSQDARQAAALVAQVKAGDRDGLPPDALTVTNAQWGVTCTTCHYEHTDSKEPFNLVQPANDLCTSCHTNPADSATVHHPVREMFEGVSLVPGIDGFPGNHFKADDGPRCVTCHMQALPVADGTTRASHGFTPILPGDSEQVPSACAGCHDTLTTTDLELLVTNTQASVKARLETDQAQFASLPQPADGSAELARYQQASAALDFVRNDGSFGVHNYTYTDTLLTAAEQELAALSGAT
ncbi:MAG: cytochrome c3 family protein, partial [Chloroflexota bacterium]